MLKFEKEAKPKSKRPRSLFERLLLATPLTPSNTPAHPNWLSTQLWPDFEELPIGLMAFTILLMALLEPDLRILVDEGISGSAGLLWIGGLFNVMIFGSLALFHVFSGSKKTKKEKRGMVALAAFCCIVSGLLGGYRLYLEQSSLVQLFGVWNIVQGLAVALLLAIKAINESSLTAKETPLTGAIANFVIIAALYVVLKYGLAMHYLDNFSICVAYAMTFSSAVCNFSYFSKK